MNNLTNYNDIILHSSTMNEVKLKGRDKRRENRFKFTNNHLSHHFLVNIAKENRSKLIDKFTLVLFRNQSNKSLVHSCNIFNIYEDIINQIIKISSYNIPIGLIK